MRNYFGDHIKLAPVLYDDSHNKEELPSEINSFHLLKKILLDENALEEYKEIVLLESRQLF